MELGDWTQEKPLGLVGGRLAVKLQVTTRKTASGYLPAALNIECLLSVVKLFSKEKKNPLVFLKKFYMEKKSLAAYMQEGFGFEMGKQNRAKTRRKKTTLLSKDSEKKPNKQHVLCYPAKITLLVVEHTQWVLKVQEWFII